MSELRPAADNVSWSEIATLPRDIADYCISYGDAPQQYGELRLPPGKGRHPVIVFIHGGCWLNAYGLDHVAPLCRALSLQGYAVWTPEYRRIGDAGGGWPGTFEDISNSLAAVQKMAGSYGLRLDRVIVMGHSAGGHLALWLAACKNLPPTSCLFNRYALVLHGVVSLAGIADLLAYERLGNECARSLPGLLGGTSLQVPERWSEADPVRLLPIDTPVKLVHGDIDAIVPLAQSAGMAKACGGDLCVLTGGGHFDLVSPHARAFPFICEALKDLRS
jgi:acetyl esterase/lipase